MEINGQMLADVSGDEIEQFLLDNALVGENSTPVAVPTNAPCSDEQHAAMAAGEPVRFKNSL